MSRRTTNRQGPQAGKADDLSGLTIGRRVRGALLSWPLKLLPIVLLIAAIYLMQEATQEEQGSLTRAILVGHTGPIQSVAFAPDGRTLASASLDQTVQQWEVSTGRMRAMPLLHGTLVYCVAFAPDGQILATGGQDSALRLWAVATEDVRATLVGHTNAVRAVAFSPDGRTLASASSDGTVRLWDVVTGREGAVLKRHAGPVHCVAFTPDGQTLAAGGPRRHGDALGRRNRSRSRRPEGTRGPALLGRLRS
jgi:WD40 repeat protein